MSTTGPSRTARRQKSLKPYDRPPPAQSTFHTILGIIAAPFRRVSRSKKSKPDVGSTDGEERDVARSLSSESESTPPTSFAPSEPALMLAKRAKVMEQTGSSIYPPIPPPSDVFGSSVPDTAFKSAFFNNQEAGPSRPIAAAFAPQTPKAKATALAPSTPTSVSPFKFGDHYTPRRASNPSPEKPTAYQPIVDFLQSKGSEKLNEFEVLGLTESIRKTGGSPKTKDIIEFMEASASVPTAALLNRFRSPSTAPPSPEKTPFLAPLSPAKLATPSPSTRKTRRRQTYLGVGSSTPSRPTVNGRIPRTPMRTSLGPSTPGQPEAQSSTKKRRVSEFGPANDEHTPAAEFDARTSPINGNSFPSSKSALNGDAGSSKPAEQPTSTPVKPTNGVHRFLRNGTAYAKSPAVPSPLRQVSTRDAADSPPKGRPRKSDTATKSQASAAILDLINDEVKSSPSKPTEVTNPFQTSAPVKLTPAKKPARKLPRVSQATTPNKATLSSKRPAPLDTDNLLDQIESTAPQSPTKKTRVEGPAKSALFNVSAETNPVSQVPTPSESAPTVKAKVLAFENTSKTSTPRTPVATKATNTIHPPFPEASTKATPTSIFNGTPKPQATVWPGKPVPLWKGAPSQKEPSPDPIVIEVEPETILMDESDGFDYDRLRHTPKEPSPQPFTQSVDDEMYDAPVPQNNWSAEFHGSKPGFPTIEEISDEDEPDQPSPSPAVKPNSIEEPDREVQLTPPKVVPAPSFNAPGTKVTPLFKPTTSPVVPSPLRHVSLPPADSDGEPRSASSPKGSPKTRALDMATADLPSFPFVAPDMGALTAASKADHVTAKGRAGMESIDHLPVYIFSGDPDSPSHASTSKSDNPTTTNTGFFGFGPSQPEKSTDAVNGGMPDHEKGKAPLTPSIGFNWGAAGISAPKVDPGSWQCSLCMVNNPKSASKCVSCETAR